MKGKAAKPRKIEEQGTLIETMPDNIKPIIELARQYKLVQSDRIDALTVEKELKQKILTEIHNAGLKPLDNGDIKFTYDGFTITVKHRDELIQVKEASEEPED